MLRNAFNALAKINGRAATLRRLGSPDQETAITIVRSNYYANLQGPESITISKREFIIPVDTIAEKFTPVLKKGDKIISDLYGQVTIDELSEMTDVGGDIMGYRIRCEF
jgi:hypothetical protein